MKLRAFNLIPGLVIDDPDSPGDVLVVMSVVRRNAETETITVAARNQVKETRFDFAFNYYINLVGVAVNPFEWEDDDYGTPTNREDVRERLENQEELRNEVYESTIELLNQKYGEVHASTNMSVAALIARKVIEP